MDHETVYLADQFEFQCAEVLMKTACGKPQRPIALLIDATTVSRECRKRWRTCARRAIRYLDGVELIGDNNDQSSGGLKTQLEKHEERRERAQTVAASLDQLECQLDENRIRPAEAFVQLISRHVPADGSHSLANTGSVLAAFNGSEDAIYQANRAIVSTNTREFVNIWARQNYQRHLGHIRLLQNMLLMRRLGVDPMSIKPRRLLEFGPGVGGLYPFFLSRGSRAEVVDKNSALRYIALQRGADATHDVEFGKSDRQNGSNAIDSVGSAELVVGIGILNIFLYESVKHYENTVGWLSSKIRDGGMGIWVTYNQPSTAQGKSQEFVRRMANVSRDVFLNNGWEDVTDTALMGDRNQVGLDYRHNADFRVFMYRSR